MNFYASPFSRARADAYDGARLYDPAHPGFQPTGRMLTPRAGHTTTRLSDGQVLIAGGTSEGRRPLASAELYDPDRGVFTSTADMTTHRIGQTATLLRTDQVLIAGGLGDSALNDASAELYIPEGFSTAAAYTKAVTNHHNERRRGIAVNLKARINIWNASRKPSPTLSLGVKGEGIKPPRITFCALSVFV